MESLACETDYAGQQQTWKESLILKVDETFIPKLKSETSHPVLCDDDVKETVFDHNRHHTQSCKQIPFHM